MSSHEINTLERREKPDATIARRVPYLRESARLSKKLGLGLHTSMVRRETTTIESAGRIAQRPLTDDELTILHAWFPTKYTSAASGRGYYRELEGFAWTRNGLEEKRLSAYNYDRIPLPVLKEWERVRDAKMFRRFEIWTPEVAKTDPALIGINGNAYYLIGRWGESDANLISFDGIKAALKRRWLNGEGFANSDYCDWSGRAIASTVIGLAGFLISTAFVNKALGISIPTSTGIAAVVGVAAAVYAYHSLRARAMNQSPLMRAIVRHDALPKEP